jgi:hypothetical protein
MDDRLGSHLPVQPPTANGSLSYFSFQSGRPAPGPILPYGEGPVSAFLGRKWTVRNPPETEIQTGLLPNSGAGQVGGPSAGASHLFRAGQICDIWPWRHAVDG